VTDAENILELTDLTARYHDGTEGLAGVSLSVPRGQRVAVIGPNGGGKTTLLLAVMGALEFDGRIAVDGLELGRRNRTEIRNRCGMMFQNADDQLFMPSLLEDVAFGPLNQGLSPAGAEQAARRAIADVGLAGHEQRVAHHLSDGQKRSAALATLLSMKVRLLLLDEPGSSLDARSRRRLGKLLNARDQAMLLATHDLALARQLCTRAVLLDGGKLIADAGSAELLEDRDLLRCHGVV
jgi:cobalt/nickel transport system ATP-binding protein